MGKNKFPQFSVYSLKNSRGDTVITVSTKQLRDRLIREYPAIVSFVEIRVNKGLENWLNENV